MRKNGSINSAMTWMSILSLVLFWMKRKLYAIPVMLGCVLFTIVLAYFPDQHLFAGLVCILISFGLRAAAIHWNLAVPQWSTSKDA